MTLGENEAKIYFTSKAAELLSVDKIAEAATLEPHMTNRLLATPSMKGVTHKKHGTSFT